MNYYVGWDVPTLTSIALVNKQRGLAARAFPHVLCSRMVSYKKMFAAHADVMGGSFLDKHNLDIIFINRYQGISGNNGKFQIEIII